MDMRPTADKETRIVISHCDLCNDELPKEADNIQNTINVLYEIDDSFESEYDKYEPRLLLCSFCSTEHNIPSYLHQGAFYVVLEEEQDGIFIKKLIL